MGFRTVVMLNNDQSHEWGNDPDLGKKITTGAAYVSTVSHQHLAKMPYGRVVECVHADVRTLAVLEHYESFIPLAQTQWYHSENQDAVQLTILREAAEKFGYKLVKRSSR